MRRFLVQMSDGFHWAGVECDDLVWHEFGLRFYRFASEGARSYTVFAINRTAFICFHEFVGEWPSDLEETYTRAEVEVA